MRVTLAIVLPMFSVAFAAQQFRLSPPNLLLQHDSLSHSVRNSVALPAGYFGVSHVATNSTVFVAAYTVAESNYDAALLSFDASSLALNFKVSFPLPGNQYPVNLAAAADGACTLTVYSDATRPSSLLYLRLDAHTGALLGVTTSDPQGLPLTNRLPLAKSLPGEPLPAAANTPELKEASGASPVPPSVTFCVPASDPTPADCDTVLAEDPVTPGALAGRTPLILIHDAWATPSLSTLDRSYWNSLLGAFAATPQFLTRYKVFRFHYLTGQHNVWDLARSLRNHLDALIFNQPEYDTQFTLIGHGLGGLLARSYMDHHWHWSGSASSVWRARRAGERVLWTIALAAPHNGTPLFTASSLAAQAATAGFWSARGCLNCTNLADYATGLTISPTFDRKVIAYWGYIGTNSAVAALARASQAELATAGAIEASGIALERLLTNNRSHANAQLSLANDGYIPGSSAALDQRSPARRVACPNHDHTLMLYGSAALCSNGMPLLNSVLADLGTPAATLTPSTPPPVTPYTPSAGCSYTLAPAAANHSYNSATNAVTVTATAGCSWQVQSHAPWISITATSANSFTYLVETNHGAFPRFGLISAGSSRFYVTQDSVTGACVYDLDPNFRSYSSSVISGLVTVLAPSTCSWTPSADSPWLSVSTTSLQTGTKPVPITGSSNASGQARFGVVRITPASGAPLLAQITQDASTSPCFYTLSSSASRLPAGSDTGAFAVQATGSCTWSAATSDAWITLSSAAAGTGTANIAFAVQPNTGSSRRFGAITILAGNTSLSHQVVQEAPAAPVPAINIASRSISFGNSLVDRPTYQTVAVRNTGQATLYPAGINQISGSLGFQVETPLTPIPAGGAGYFVLSYTPGGQVAQSAIFRLTSNDPAEGAIDLSLDGAGIGAAAGNNLIVAPSTINFGEVPTGAVAEIPVTIQNRDVTPLNLTYNWTQSGDFRVLNAPASLAVNTAATLRLRLLPTSTGAKSATFRVTSSGTGAPFYDVAITATAISPATADIQTVRTIPLSGAGTPAHLAIRGGRAYITRNNPAGLSVVDLATGSVSANIPISTYPTASTGQPAVSGARVFVPLSNLGSNGQVAVFDANSNSLLQYFGAGTDPHGAAVVDNLLWVSNANCPSSSGLSMVRAFDATTLAPQPAQLAGRVAVWLAADADTRRIAVANTGCGASNPAAGASLIDLNSNLLLQTRDLRPSPNSVVTSGGKAYFNTGQSVEGVDLSSFATVASIPIPESSHGIAAAGGYVFTASGGVVTVISTATHRVVGTVPVPGAVALAADAASTTAYAVTPTSLVGIRVQQPSFDFTCAAPALLVPSTTCSASPLDGFSTVINLQCASVPGVSCLWSPSTITAPGTATLTVTTSSLAPGHYPLQVQASGGGVTRSATLSLVSPSCSFTVAQGTHGFGGAGGSSSVEVQAPGVCAWAAASNASWITITSGGAYSGNGTVAFTVATNSTASARSGTLTVAGQTVNVEQQAAECGYQLTPASAVLASAAGAGSVSLTTSSSACAWTAVSNNPSWLTLTSAASGTGSAAAAFSFTANPSTSPRQGSLTIGGVTFTVSQDAATCAYSISPTSASLNSQADTGALSVTATPAACSWTATSNAAWLSVLSGASGAGNGQVSYGVTANPGPAARSAVLTVAGQAFSVTQAGSGCAFTLSPASSSSTAGGGSFNLAVQASHASCGWTAVSNAPWLAISSPASGTGSGTVSYTVAANPGLAERIGLLSVGGNEFRVTQAGDTCRFTVDPLTLAVDANTHAAVVTVSASHSACGWTSSSPAPWAAITSGESVTGSGSVAIAIANNTATQARTANLNVAGNAVRVDQSGLACSYGLSSESAVLDASGGTLSVNILANSPSCAWTAVSNAAWITITGAAGAGSGPVTFVVAGNPNLTERTGTLTIAGRTFTATQTALACSISLSSPAQSTSPAAGSGTLSITANHAGCPWAAQSEQPWLTLTAPASGAGTSLLHFSFTANTAPAGRQAAINVSGQSFLLTQAAAPCTYTLSPQSSQNLPATAGSSSVSVSPSDSACAWTATSPAGWVTITAGASRTGPGPVGYSFTANPTANPRSATLAIAGLPFNVVQAGACSFTLDPASNNAASSGGDYTVAVTASTAGCAWTAASSQDWVTIISPAAGAGNGAVNYRVAANPGAAPRAAQVTIGDQLHSIVQAPASCVFSLPSGGASFNAAAVAGGFSLSASGASCPWTASSSAAWITLTSPASGAGGATIAFSLAANPDTTARTGSITAGGQSYSITQTGASCSYTLLPSSQVFGPEGAGGSLAVSASPSACPWTAASNAPWITLTSAASGAGSGTVSFSVAANADLQARSGTISLAGREFQVSQAAAPCTYSLQPASGSYPPAGGAFGVAVAASAAACPWTASTTTPWISVTSGMSGAGPGSVGFSISANTASALRSGSLTIAGKTFPVIQQGVNCQFAVTPLLLQHSSGGGSGIIDVSASSASCPWSAVVNDNWISLTPPLSGAGSASIPYTIASHAGLSGRSGSLTVAGSTIAVNQAGVQCALTLSENSAYAGAGGASQTVQLTLTHSACPWTAVSDASWLTITSAASGTGSGSLNFSIAPLPSQGARTAHLTINGALLTVDQFGVSQPGRTPTAVFRHTSGGIAVASYPSSTFKLNGGIFGGEPAATQDALGNTYFASLDRHGGAYANTFLAATESWAQLRFGGGDFQGNLSVTTAPNGAVFVAGRDRWRGYWVTTFSTAGGFAPWVRLGGVFDTDPSIAASPDGSVYVVGRDTWGGLWANQFVPDSGWQGWNFGGGIVNGKPSVVVGTDGVAYVAARDYFGSLWLARLRRQRWLGWSFGAGSGLASEPAIAANGAGTVYVVARTSGGSVYYRGFTEGTAAGWHPWVDAGGVLATASAAGSSGDLYVFGRDPDGYHWWFRAGASQWTNVGNRNYSVTGPAASPR